MRKSATTATMSKNANFEQLTIGKVAPPDDRPYEEEEEEEEEINPEIRDELHVRMELSRSAMTPNRSTYGLGVEIRTSERTDAAKKHRSALERLQDQDTPIDPSALLLPPIICTGCGLRLNFIKLHRLLTTSYVASVPAPSAPSAPTPGTEAEGAKFSLRSIMDQTGAVRICCSASMLEDPLTVELIKTIDAAQADRVDVSELFEEFITQNGVETAESFVTQLVSGGYSSVNQLMIPGLREPLIDYEGYIIPVEQEAFYQFPTSVAVLEAEGAPELKDFVQHLNNTNETSVMNNFELYTEGMGSEMASAFNFILDNIRGGGSTAA